jgi:hypothetical protein
MADIAAMETQGWKVFMQSSVPASQLKYNRIVLDFHQFLFRQGYLDEQGFLMTINIDAQCNIDSLTTAGTKRKHSNQDSTDEQDPKR